jgi:hypothetical protein
LNQCIIIVYFDTYFGEIAKKLIAKCKKIRLEYYINIAKGNTTMMYKKANEIYEQTNWGESTQDDWGNSYHEYNNQ